LLSPRRQAHLVEEDQHIRQNQRDVDERRRACRVDVLQRDHESALPGVRFEATAPR